MTAIPLMFDIKGKKTVIVGGGKVAERRIHTLVEGEAAILVVSPVVRPKIQAFNEEGLIQWKQKEFSPNDLQGAVLVVAATNDSQTNRAVIDHAPARALINSVEKAVDGNIQFPNHVKRGKLSIAISTHGASPILTSKIKQQLEEQYDDRYEGYVDFLFEARALVKQTPLSSQEKRQILKQLVTEEDFFHSNYQEHMLNHLHFLIKKG